MNDHVAVLRVLRDFYAGSVLDHSEKAAALTHAIATCEQHAALVARLGELEADLRNAAKVDPHYGLLRPTAATICTRIADDLARVVAGNGGGDGR